jgi:acyl-coenzyme A thioesterase PaaI-like protein
MYCAVLAAIGPVPLAVTINLNINFLRRPAASDLLAEARLMKLGKRLAVGEVTMRSEGSDGAVAHVMATYSIPPDQEFLVI